MNLSRRCFHSCGTRGHRFQRRESVITDYFQFETGSRNPFSRIVTWYANRMLVKAYNNSQLRIFADNASFIPKKIPKFEIVGPILEQTPPESREELRRRLFPGKSGIVIVVSVGGTSVGKYLLDFFVSNQKSFREALDSTLVLLLGPRIDRESIFQTTRKISSSFRSPLTRPLTSKLQIVL